MGDQRSGEPRLCNAQYQMLLRCSERKDTAEWNQWRGENPNREIRLEGVNLAGAYLEGVDLTRAYLKGACFNDARLVGARFHRARLQEAKFIDAHLQGTIFYEAHLQSSLFQTALVDGVTSFWGCIVDRQTVFNVIGLGNVRIEAGTKQLLEYNLRRTNWKHWYRKHRFQQVPWRAFWWVSDYGSSLGRVALVFAGFALAFAVAYWLWPGLVVFNGTSARHEFQNFWHAIYFSVVTMTTLGFGDIAANPSSWLGQTLLMLQVLLGYVLLGALVTRFAVLFTSDGPPGTFASNDSC